MAIKIVRKKTDQLDEMLEEMKIGDPSLFDEVTGYEITKVPNGFIYKNEYCGLCFVPAEEKIKKPSSGENVAGIKSSVAKTGPKKVVKK